MFAYYKNIVNIENGCLVKIIYRCVNTLRIEEMHYKLLAGNLYKNNLHRVGNYVFIVNNMQAEKAAQLTRF